MNIRLLVCDRCYDVPQEQNRAIVVPADPVPIINARPENFQGDSSDYRITSDGTVLDPKTGIPVPSTTLRTTMDCQNRVTTALGKPTGADQNAVQPLFDGVTYGVALPVLSVSGDGVRTVTVTCSAVHNLQTNNQVAVRGLVPRNANGFYSVTVSTATMFSYETYDPVPAGSLIGSGNVRIVTLLIGLPTGMTTIPEVGPSAT